MLCGWSAEQNAAGSDQKASAGQGAVSSIEGIQCLLGPRAALYGRGRHFVLIEAKKPEHRSADLCSIRHSALSRMASNGKSRGRKRSAGEGTATPQTFPILKAVRNSCAPQGSRGNKISSALKYRSLSHINHVSGLIKSKESLLRLVVSAESILGAKLDPHSVAIPGFHHRRPFYELQRLRVSRVLI